MGGAFNTALFHLQYDTFYSLIMIVFIGIIVQFLILKRKNPIRISIQISL